MPWKFVEHRHMQYMSKKVKICKKIQNKTLILLLLNIIQTYNLPGYLLDCLKKTCKCI